MMVRSIRRAVNEQDLPSLRSGPELLLPAALQEWPRGPSSRRWVGPLGEDRYRQERRGGALVLQHGLKYDVLLFGAASSAIRTHHVVRSKSAAKITLSGVVVILKDASRNDRMSPTGSENRTSHFPVRLGGMFGLSESAKSGRRPAILAVPTRGPAPSLSMSWYLWCRRNDAGGGRRFHAAVSQAVRSNAILSSNSRPVEAASATPATMRRFPASSSEFPSCERRVSSPADLVY